jgi:hypothetical protein
VGKQTLHLRLHTVPGRGGGGGRGRGRGRHSRGGICAIEPSMCLTAYGSYVATYLRVFQLELLFSLHHLN